MISKFEQLATVLSTETGKLAIAGVAGAMVRWVTLRNNWKEGLSALVVGGICATYVGPLMAPLMEPLIGAVAPDGDTTGFSAFVVGLGGISISGMLIDIINARRSKLNAQENQEEKSGG